MKPRRVTPHELVPNGIYTMRDVAQLVFAHSYRWFYENHERLARDEGFPRPISKFGFPRWNGTDLIAWLARPKLADEAPAEGSGRRGNVHDFSSLLASRSATLASKRHP
jgi:hypothetical protein